MSPPPAARSSGIAERVVKMGATRLVLTVTAMSSSLASSISRIRLAPAESDQDVDAAELRRDLIEGGVHIVAAGDIGDDRDGAGPDGLDDLVERQFAPRQQHYRRAVLREANSRWPGRRPRCTGDARRPGPPCLADITLLGVARSSLSKYADHGASSAHCALQ